MEKNTVFFVLSVLFSISNWIVYYLTSIYNPNTVEFISNYDIISCIICLILLSNAILFCYLSYTTHPKNKVSTKWLRLIVMLVLILVPIPFQALTILFMLSATYR